MEPVRKSINDAKNAVISIPSSLPYISGSSNNTTFTIKSAPARTPEVLNPVSIKCGWLSKKDESSNWNKRWCCVVPHTFLYYFSDNAPASSPVGIIDLECYSNVVRESSNVLKLTGEKMVNPDLREFFFKAENESNGDAWTESFLSDRYNAMVDEREALRELQTSFSTQFNVCNKMMDEAEEAQKRAEEETYAIRSANERLRETVKVKAIEVLKVIGKQTNPNSVESQRAVKLVMSSFKSGDVGAMLESVLDRVSKQDEYVADLKKKLYESEFKLTEDIAGKEVEMSSLKKEFEVALNLHGKARERAERELEAANEKREEIQRNLDTVTLEFNILAGQKEKVDKKKKEIAEHKKILVKEVVVQRGRVEYFSERNKLLESSIERKKAKITGLKTTISELRGALENKERLLGAVLRDRQVSQSSKLSSKLSGGDSLSREDSVCSIPSSMSFKSADDANVTGAVDAVDDQAPSPTPTPPAGDTPCNSAPPSPTAPAPNPVASSPISVSSSCGDSIDEALNDHDLQDKARQTAGEAMKSAVANESLQVSDILDDSDESKNGAPSEASNGPQPSTPAKAPEVIDCLSVDGRKSTTFYGNAAARKLGEEKGWETNAVVSNVPISPPRPATAAQRKPSGIMRMSSHGGGSLRRTSSNSISRIPSPERPSEASNTNPDPPLTAEEFASLSVAAKARLRAEGKASAFEV